jgi:hypothetical protein
MQGRFYYAGEETFLKESFLPPHPYLQRTLMKGILLMHNAECKMQN